MDKSAGIYVTERNDSAYIPTLSPTIAAAVGYSLKGPVNERTLVTSTVDLINKFGPPTPKYTFLHYSGLSFLEEGGTLYMTRVVQNDALTAGAFLTVDDPSASTPILRLSPFDDGTSNPQGIFDPYNNLGFLATDPAAQNTLMWIAAANPGEWNNSLAVAIRPSNKAGTTTATDLTFDPYNFYIDVYENYTGPGNRPVESFLICRETKLDGFGQQLYLDEVNRKSNYIRVRNNPFCANLKVLTGAFCFFAGGSNGTPPTDIQISAAWDLYSDTEVVDVNILINAGVATPTMQHAMSRLSDVRMDCVALLDVPSNMQQVADAITYRVETLNIDSDRCALYTPDIKIKDPYNDIELFVPLSGFAAAVYARTDRNTFLWNAPAGLSRGALNVLGVRHVYNQVARDALDTNQLCMVRSFPDGKGSVIWAQNTLASQSSALSNINVRRLMCYLEKNIARSALYSIFESNTKVLRLQLQTLVERFMLPIRTKGGVYDFKVVCDDTNNTPNLIASGDVILDVYIDAVIPAKRIHLNAIIVRTGAVFKAALASV